MANITDIYTGNSKFLKAEDLMVNGKATKPVVEIETAEIRENTYNGEVKNQVVLSFVGKEKVLGLNVTNARRIAQLISPDTDEWPGYRIKLYVDQTTLQNGQVVDCIRVVPDLPEQTHQKARAAQATELEDAPF